jgi:TonB family protein
MTANRILYFAFFLCLAASAGLCADKDKSPSADELISRARQLEVRNEGAPPISVKADLQVANSKNGAVHGEYSLVWESPQHWTDTIHFSNYDRQRVRDGDTLWIKSSIDFQPFFVFQLDMLLDSSDALTLIPTEKAGKARKESKAGAEQLCTHVEGPGRGERNLCFDATSGTLVRVEYPKKEGAFEISGTEYTNFEQVGDKLLPMEGQAFDGKQAILEMKITSVDQITGNLPMLKPDPGAQPWPTCEIAVPAKLIYRVPPEYPEASINRREQGRVTLYAVLGTDGSLRNLKVIETAGANLDASATEAVRRWKYQPSMCGDKPIPAELAISVIFQARQ